jgi:Ser/Thr protein kinase RdoA (MazF antagonist)
MRSPTPTGWTSPVARCSGPAWELELTRHLHCSGVPVPEVVPLADGRLLGVIDAPEGQRAYALTTFVQSGAKPRPPFTDDLYRQFGAVIAALHTAGDSFTSTYPRRSVDLAATLVEPISLVLAELVRLGCRARRRHDGQCVLRPGRPGHL